VRAIRDAIPERYDSVEVHTVDGYQGREKEVILFSCVRSNDEGNVGFLADSRRLNVALTRARRGLIVVGDPDTLRSDETWSAWLAHIRSRNLEAWHLLGMA
jgi:superfamily I DNA and/or RNA helicase